MPCIYCGGETRIQSTKRYGVKSWGAPKEPYSITRWRKCLSCGKGFPTIETIPEHIWKKID